MQVSDPRAGKQYGVSRTARHARQVGNLPAELTSFVGRRLESTELRKNSAPRGW